MANFWLFVWCVGGAGTGLILNAKAVEYIGVTALFDRYNMVVKPIFVMILDLSFFCLLGPTIMCGLYAPSENIQAITLGLGWPYVIRGVINSVTPPAANPSAAHGDAK